MRSFLFSVAAVKPLIAMMLSLMCFLISLSAEEENLPPTVRDISLNAFAGSAVPCTLYARDDHLHSKYLWASIIEAPKHGRLELTPRYADLYPERSVYLHYVADADAPGTDSFTYQVSDGVLLSAIARCDITINPSQPPTAQDMALQVAEGSWTSISLDIQDPDYGTILLSEIVPGTVTGTMHPDFAGDPSSRIRVYRPSGQAGTSETFRYRVHDGTLSSAEATVTMEIISNTAPEVEDFARTCMQSGKTKISIQARDAETPTTLIFEVVTPPMFGTLSPTYPDRSDIGNLYHTYVPNPGFVGDDFLTFRVGDGHSWSRVARGTIEVSGNTPPQAEDQAITVEAGTETSIIFDVVDPEWGPQSLVCHIIDAPSSGTLRHADPTDPGDYLIYDPDPTFVGETSFAFQFDDGIDRSEIATCTITVKADSPAVVYDQSISTRWIGQSLERLFAYEDADLMQPCHFEVVDAPAHGRVELQALGDDLLNRASFRYTPDPGFTGQDSFTWQRSGPNEISEPAKVTINVGSSAILLLVAEDLSQDLSSGLNALQAQLLTEGYSVLQSEIAPGSTQKQRWQKIHDIYSTEGNCLSGVIMIGVEEAKPKGVMHLWDMRRYWPMSKSTKVGTHLYHHADIWVSSLPRADLTVMQRVLTVNDQTRKGEITLPQTAWVTTGANFDPDYYEEVLSPLWPEVRSYPSLGQTGGIKVASREGGDMVFRANHNGIGAVSDGVQLRTLFISGCSAAPSVLREMYRQNSKTVLAVACEVTHANYIYNFPFRVGMKGGLCAKAKLGYSWGEMLLEISPKDALFGRPYAGACFIGDLSQTVLPVAMLLQLNREPQIIAIAASPNPLSGVICDLSVQCTDPDEDILSWSWTLDQQPPDSQPVFDKGASSPRVTFNRVGEYVFSVSVNDGRGGMARDSVTVQVMPTASTIRLQPMP